MKTSIPQILEEVDKAPNKEARVKALRAYNHPVLRGILQINFNPEVKT